MQDTEELREALAIMRRERDLLHLETTHAKLLLNALDAMLSVTADDDPFIDIDDFKRINDFHGHAAGDVLLQALTRRVQAETRRSDIFGRISGDEFIIVFDPVRERSDVALIVERILKRIKQPLLVEDAEIRPSASIGVAFYPEHGLDYDTLRRHADLAMYQAKTSAKGSLSLFTHDMARKADDQLILEQGLKEAVDARQFRCALQRKIDIRSNRVVGFEALARWVDADGLIHTPSVFMSTAVRLDLLDEITTQMLDDLLHHLPALDAAFGPELKYSLNISPAQTTNLPLMQKLLRKLTHLGQAERFILELTEESFAATGPFQAHVLPTLRKAGVAISIDDFGTGYSSLAKLAEMTIDELKLDRSLISSIHLRSRNQVILRAVESLGSALNMSIVAEGIETPAENDYLLAHTQIRIGQGFLHHRPQLIAELLDQ